MRIHTRVLHCLYVFHIRWSREAGSNPATPKGTKLSLQSANLQRASQARTGDFRFRGGLPLCRWGGPYPDPSKGPEVWSVPNARASSGWSNRGLNPREGALAPRGVDGNTPRLKASGGPWTDEETHVRFVPRGPYLLRLSPVTSSVLDWPYELGGLATCVHAASALLRQ